MNLTINDKDYSLGAGMNFLREINKTVVQTYDDNPTKLNLGLLVTLIQVQGDDYDALERLLIAMNKHEEGNKLTKEILDRYFENETTDLESLVLEVFDFLLKSNVCKKTMKTLYTTQTVVTA